MQSWPSSGQQDGNGADSWQQNFSYSGQNSQFNPNQQWSQPGNNGQARAYQQLMPQGNTNPNYFDPNGQHGAYAQGSMPDSQNQASFHGGLPLSQDFPQHGQQMMDPAFGNMYAQQNKANGRDSMLQQGQSVGQSQAYAGQDLAFPLHGNQSYQHQQQPQQYQQNVQQRQSSHTPDQQYGHPTNSPGAAQLQHMHNLNLQQPQQQQYQQQLYGMSGQFNPQQTLQHQQHQHQLQHQHQQHQQQQQQQAPSQPPPQQSHPSKAAFSHVSIAPANSSPQLQSLSHPVAKPRSVSATESIASASDAGVDVSSKKLSDVYSLAAPAPTADEMQLLDTFKNRTGDALQKYPPVPGAPHLAFDGSAILPTPKSYDKLAPMIAMPSQSGNPMAPELGHDLPCEIQGKFSSHYQPVATKGGLEERKVEAKSLLDNFEASMTALGKRRPKYTEYPHSFKEQIKSDEASKNKKAKKESASKPVRPSIRPTDLAAAAAWDAIGFVHIEDGSTPTSSIIAQRVQQAGDFFIKLRMEMNKSKTELDQAIKDGAADADITRKREDTEQKKEAFFKALDATVEHADDAIMDNLGGHHKLVLSLVNALISSIKANDFSGRLPKIVLEMFTHFRMTKKIAETTNFDTVRKRFEDKGDDDAKAFAREITAKVKKVLKGSEAETATGYTGTSASSRAKTSSKAEPASGKRARDDDSEASRTVKKIAVESGAGALSKKLAAPKAAASTSKATSAPKIPTTSILPGKSRTAIKPTPKPEPVKVDSPPAAIEEAKKPAAKAEKPPAPKMAAPPSSSALSGIASLLDSINAPKAETPIAVAPKEGSDSEGNETPAEAARRLRKEARRKLTVKWKPDEELVQIKIFHKDDNEDEGRADNMTKDAGDDKSEGMVLKQRADIEEDDDDDDVPYQPWTEPVETDFTSLPEDVRNKNYVNRAGSVAFSTVEQQRIADREQKELMAIYAVPEDIPPTPRSPVPEIIAALPDAVQLPQEDKFAEVRKRWVDSEQMGPDGALYAAMGRLDTKKRTSGQLNSIMGQVQDSASQGSAETPVTSITVSTSQTSLPLVSGPSAAEAVLAWLKSEKLKNWQDPAPIQADLSRPYHYSDPSAQAVGNMIEVLVRYLANKPFPATSPPDWMLQDEQKAKEWWFGYNKEVAAKQRKADEERSAAASGQANRQDAASSYAQQQAYAPYMSILQQMAGGQQNAPSQTSQMNDNQLQSILSAINQGPQQSGGVPPPPPPPPLNSSDPSYQQLLMLSQMAQGQAGASQPAQSNEQDWDRGRDREQYRERERDWDRDRNNRDRDWDRSRDRDRNDGTSGREEYRDYRKKKPTLPPHKPVNKALIGTKACTFWQQGKCARGDQCTFRHD